MFMKFRYSKIAFLITTLTVAAISPRAFSAPLTVTSLADSGAGTLRDRIAAALPGDTIQFGLSGAITLNSELVLSKSLRINGLTANSLRISGNNHSRVFNIASGNVQIYNLTIADGRVVGTNGAVGLNGETVAGGGICVANGATLSADKAVRRAAGAKDGVAPSPALVRLQWFDAPWLAIPPWADRLLLRDSGAMAGVADCTSKVQQTCPTQPSLLIMP
jgi:hypothetical protein